MTFNRIFAAAVFVGGLAAGCASAQTIVPTGPFESVELRGGGHVLLRYGPSERVSLIQGSTDYTRFHIEDGNKLVIDTCGRDNGMHECPSNYDLDVEIVTPRISGVAISGGGKIETAPGFPVQGEIDAAVEGGGNIDVRAIEAKNASAAVDGGGKIYIRADGHLNAAVNGGGSIRYTGTTNVTSAIDGGGSVQPVGG
jgi:hypothetical protein